MAKFIDLQGKVFGRLTVLSRDGATSNGETKWLCQCSCGVVKTLVGVCLRNGNTTSCGCYSKEVHKISNSTHGLGASPVYGVWRNMLNRCRNPNDKRWHCYGGKGVIVCPEWKDFTTFHNWAMSSGFKEGLTLERKKVGGNYEPSNCTWIPRKEQIHNRTNTVKVLFNGQVIPIIKACRELNLNYSAVMARIYRGKTPEEAIA